MISKGTNPETQKSEHLPPNGIGVDIGGVIIEAITDRRAGYSAEVFSTVPEVPGAISSLGILAAQSRVHLVSKCSPAVEVHTREWLRQHNFGARTGIPDDNIHFCRTRAEKGPIAQDLGLSAFIDDRQDVLHAMPPHVTGYLFRPANTDPETTKHVRSKRYTIVHGWPDLMQRIAPGGAAES